MIQYIVMNVIHLWGDQTFEFFIALYGKGAIHVVL